MPDQPASDLGNRRLRKGGLPHVLSIFRDLCKRALLIIPLQKMGSIFGKQVLLLCADQRRAARVQVALLRYGCMVEVAGTFRRGLTIIQHRPPTAIVIDESLPGLDNRLLAQVLAANSASSRPAVVILPLDAHVPPRM